MVTHYYMFFCLNYISRLLGVPVSSATMMSFPWYRSTGNCKQKLNMCLNVMA